MREQTRSIVLEIALGLVLCLGSIAVGVAVAAVLWR